MVSEAGRCLRGGKFPATSLVQVGDEERNHLLAVNPVGTGETSGSVRVELRLGGFGVAPAPSCRGLARKRTWKARFIEALLRVLALTPPAGRQRRQKMLKSRLCSLLLYRPTLRGNNR